MAHLLDELVHMLEQLPQNTVGQWKDSNHLRVFGIVKEIAHFQGNLAMNIRLTACIIMREELRSRRAILSHHNRPQCSRWPVHYSANGEDADEVVSPAANQHVVHRQLTPHLMQNYG